MTQEAALSILKTGGNVFLTGEPGSGKTHTVNAYISYLRDHEIEPSITASTGIAATHVGGMTIHSWSGIGIKKFLSTYDLEAMMEKESLSKRVASARVLIIDEISMLDSKVLDMVDLVCKKLRRNGEPFGGLQVIFVGDFFQLPPVSRQGDGPIKFAFESNAWREANTLVCYLSEQHRQDDELFVQALGAIRSGNTDHASSYFEVREYMDQDEIENKTKLFTHNADVDRLNDEALSRIDGETHLFEMQGIGKSALVEQLKKGCLSPERLKLKDGAVVMFTKNNFEQGYVNGTLGTIIGFEKDSGYPIVEIKSGKQISVTPLEWVIEDGRKILAKIIQLPLRLAWAITVHKSQGMSMDSAIIDLSQSFEYGQGYVALSRVRTLKGLTLTGVNERAFQVHPKIIAKDAEFKEQSDVVAQTFSTLPKSDLEMMHQNFIKACGGSIEKKIVKKKESAGGGSGALAKIREKYPNAYMPWSDSDDLDLEERFRDGEKIKDIAIQYGRQQGSIEARLRKLGLIE